ncbi:MAG: ComF family protein [Chlamydiales bacterium]
MKNSLQHLFYPSQCLHCHDLTSPDSSLLCEACASLLELINPEERCPVCFDLQKSHSTHECRSCRGQPSLLYRIGAAFDYIGPAATLIKKLKYANQPHLARGLAAFLIAQYDQLDWPLPDAFIPVPLSFSHWLERGYNQSSLIAEEMGRLLGLPVWHALKRRSGDFSQAGLTLAQRKELNGQPFKLRKKYSLQNRTFILIDDVMTSGTTLRKCAECLMEASPACVYALTVCKTY